MSETQSMVERVAAALFDALGEHGEWERLELQGGRITICGSFAQDVLARAAIEAVQSKRYAPEAQG